MPTNSEGYEPKTVHFDMPVQSIKLPPFQNSIEALPNEDIAQIAAGHDFLICLTTQGRVLWISTRSPVINQQARGEPALEGETRSVVERELLASAYENGSMVWHYLPQFSDISIIKEHASLRGKTVKATRITHISAQFHSFTAYAVDTVKENGLVLIGESVGFVVLKNCC